MEACSFGNVSIAKILLQFKARASSKDDDDWTALEYLRECSRNERTSGSDKEKLQKLAELIAQRQSEGINKWGKSHYTKLQSIMDN